ncbi:MAG TPA: hypothetical protein VLK82_06535, partial [Candidatus Tectomicrobia bacterium]|nr:hypothetical protein [Candidatus Tectomicrobia bacterium]
MSAEPRHTKKATAQSPPQASPERAPQKAGGRPKGPPSTILNLRIPLDLVARLDRYLDYLEVHTGLKANRGMIARRALELFLETHGPGERGP